MLADRHYGSRLLGHGGTVTGQIQGECNHGVADGYNTLHKHSLHLMGLTEDPTCRFCKRRGEESAVPLMPCRGLISSRLATPLEIKDPSLKNRTRIGS